MPTTNSHQPLRAILLRGGGMCIGAVLLLHSTGQDWPWALFGAGLFLALTAVFLPGTRLALRGAFHKLEGALLASVTWILLGIVYLFIFTPGRFLVRASPSDRRAAPQTASLDHSFWVRPRQSPSARIRYTRTF